MSLILPAKKKLLMAPMGPPVKDYFNASVWAGSGASRSITTPIDSTLGSLVWIKARNININHFLFDTLRGPGIALRSNISSGNSIEDIVTAFTSTGYSLDASGGGNALGSEYVGWQFRKAPKFFDVIQYSGNSSSARQMAHSLGIDPGMIIVKNVDLAINWAVYHRGVGPTRFFNFEATSSASVGAAWWNNTAPTATHFTLGNQARVNGSGYNYVAYLFAHDVAADGSMQCGDYIGNGSAQVIELGWRPQYLLIRNATATGDWNILDAARGLGQSSVGRLYSNLANAESSTSAASWVDTTPTGFQINTSDSQLNTNGAQYVYLAVREAA